MEPAGTTNVLHPELSYIGGVMLKAVSAGKQPSHIFLTLHLQIYAHTALTHATIKLLCKHKKIALEHT